MRLSSFCVAAIIALGAFVSVTPEKANAQSYNMVHCPRFTANQWTLRNGTSGNTYGLMLTNDKTSCSDATTWIKKMMKGSFSGFLPVEVKGPAGYDCHVTPDAKNGPSGGTCHKTDSSGNITAGWDWSAEKS